MTRVVLFVFGGTVERVTADAPVEAVMVDYDCDDADDDIVTEIADGDGGVDRAVVDELVVTVRPDEVERYFKVARQQSESVLRDAARRVVDSWEHGDLAGAVRDLADLLD